MKKMKMSRSNQILFKNIFPGSMGFKKIFPWKGIISENSAFFIFHPLPRSSDDMLLSSCWCTQHVSSASGNALCGENNFFFFLTKSQDSRKIFFLQEIQPFDHYQANRTPLPLGPLPELFTHRLVQANHLGFVLLYTIWYCMRLELLWIKKCFTVTPLCSVEESWAHSPMRKDYPCLRRRVDRQDTAAWIQGTHRKRCWEGELAVYFSLFSCNKMALEQNESNMYKWERGML